MTQENNNAAIFRCSECGKEFSYLSELKNHQSEHAPENFYQTDASGSANSASSAGEKKWGNKMVTGFLVVLTIITLAQTAQSLIILNSLDADPVVAAEPRSTTSTKNNAPLPSSIDNLPNMVGGC